MMTDPFERQTQISPCNCYRERVGEKVHLQEETGRELIDKVDKLSRER